MKFPSKCPHCGKDIAENPVCITYEEVVDKSLGARAEAHKCIHCKKYIYAFRGFVKKNNDYIVDDKGIICYYPVKKYVDYPNRVKDFCPSAYKIYNQTCSAKDHGLTTLLGAGLRMALEHLITDYLINIQSENKDDVLKNTLVRRIGLLKINDDTQICANLVRIFGNDTIHYRPLSDIEIEEAYEYYGALLANIDFELSKRERKARLEQLYLGK